MQGLDFLHRLRLRTVRQAGMCHAVIAQNVPLCNHSLYQCSFFFRIVARQKENCSGMFFL